MLERPGGHHNLGGTESLAVGVHRETGSVPGHPGDPGVVPDRQSERVGVLGEVLRGSVFRGIAVRIAGEWQAREAGVPGRGEQGQRVPSRPPDMADLAPGVHDQERPAALLQRLSDRQTGLAGADHDHLEDWIRWLFDMCCVGRHGSAPRNGVLIRHECWAGPGAVAPVKSPGSSVGGARGWLPPTLPVCCMVVVGNGNACTPCSRTPGAAGAVRWCSMVNPELARLHC